MGKSLRRNLFLSTTLLLFTLPPLYKSGFGDDEDKMGWAEEETKEIGWGEDKIGLADVVE